MLETLQNEGKIGGGRDIDLVCYEIVDRQDTRLVLLHDDVNALFLEKALAIGHINEGRLNGPVHAPIRSGSARTSFADVPNDSSMPAITTATVI